MSVLYQSWYDSPIRVSIPASMFICEVLPWQADIYSQKIMQPGTGSASVRAKQVQLIVSAVLTQITFCFQDMLLCQQNGSGSLHAHRAVAVPKLCTCMR